MEKKKFDFASVAVGAGKSAAGLVGKAKYKVVQTLDQNDDGKLNMKDVSELAGAVGQVVKNSAEAVKKSADEKARELELKALQPIFKDDIEGASFGMSKLIRVCERDKKREESEVCQGAVGFYTTHQDLTVVNMYKKYVDQFGISFYPDASYEFYYVDPRDRDRYIALDEYFSYLKIERVNELQRIAQDLGAKHFKVTYKEEKTAFSSHSAKGNAKLVKSSVVGEQNGSSNEFTAVEIAAEMECAGHAPIEPRLNYLHNDVSVKNLIHLRMDEKAPITHHKFSIKMSNSSGIKENDAIKIDAVLKGFKCSGNATVVSEAKNESRRYLDYEVDF